VKKDLVSRRRFLRAAGMTAAGAALAACAPPPQAAAPAAAPAAAEPAKKEVAPTAAAAAPAAGATVQWWVGWGNLTPAVESLQKTDEFKAALGGNTFEFKPSVNAEGMLTAIAGGTPPDGASNVDYVQFMAKGTCRDISDWVATSSIVKKELFLADPWANGQWQGKQYGLPGLEGGPNYGLNYNAELVKVAGLDPDKPPVTWDELLAWHKKLTVKDASGNVKQFGLDPYDAMAGEPDFAATSYGFTWYDEDAGKHDINNPKMIDHMKITTEFIKEIGPDQLAGLRQVEGNGGWGASFNTKVQAMLIEGYWHPGETKIQKPEVAANNRATWAPVPADRAGKKIQDFNAHYIIFPKDAKNSEAMFKLGEFFCGSDVAAAAIWKEVGWLPARAGFYSTVKGDEYPGLQFYFDSVSKADETLRRPRRSPIHWFVNTQLTEVRDKVARGQMTAEEACAEVQKRADTEWKNQGYGKAGG
jgi:multiple sugar transport system substrate-binding protein